MGKCIYCGGKTVRDQVTAQAWWGTRFVLVEDVPALVCEQCGEQYYDAETSQALAELAQDPPLAKRTIEVPVYAYAQARMKQTKRQAS